MRISDWSSDVCSSDLLLTKSAHSRSPDRGCRMPNSYDPSEDIRHRITGRIDALAGALPHAAPTQIVQGIDEIRCLARDHGFTAVEMLASRLESTVAAGGYRAATRTYLRSEEHTSELQSLMRNSY